MRNLLAGTYDFSNIAKENQENQIKTVDSQIKFILKSHNKLSGTRKGLKANRSISPYTTCWYLLIEYILTDFEYDKLMYIIYLLFFIIFKQGFNLWL